MKISTVHISKSAHLTAYIADPEVGYKLYRERPGIILAPGGAYLIHATREKEGVALEFLAKGYNVFLLEYSIGFSSREAKEQGAEKLDTEIRYPTPVLETMEAVHYIKEHAEDLNTDIDRLFLLGFSAGAHLCASYGVFWNSPELTEQLSFQPVDDELKLAGMVLCYPLINPSPDKELELTDQKNPDTKLMKEFLYQTQKPTQEQKDMVNLTKHVTPNTLPAFIWHSIDDPIVNCADTTRFVLALQENGVNCEYHLYEHGGHGLGLANKIYARNETEIQPDIAAWTLLADKWMDRK